MPRLIVLLSLLALAVAAGCDSKVETFEANDVYALSLERSRRLPTEAASEDVTRVVDQLFGTPDKPRWPAEMMVTDERKRLVDPGRLARAAGPISSGRDGEHRGLYRENCAVCHGLAGSGTGPTSLIQDPYPRDFRHGVFKWKSTERPAKPTREDLVTLLRRGIHGTAMPSFAPVGPADIETLIDYVIYLSIRGEAERELLAVAMDELGYEDEPPRPELRLTSFSPSSDPEPATEAGEVIAGVLNDITADWVAADERVAEVPPLPSLPFDPPDDDQAAAYTESVERGRAIFHGQVANCAGCHGPAGSGEAELLDFDDWTKEYSSRIGLTPTDREAMKPMREAGALPPRPIEPRDLRDGVFRGGGEPETLFRRITEGIAGTPMPGVGLVDEASSRGLTDDQVWDLVRYVRSLSEEN